MLVTGASSGIGLATARRLARRRIKVFGTSRNPVDDDRAPGVAWLILDVRSDESARQAVSALVQSAGRIDTLVNNAGYKLSGASEEITAGQARDLMETNLGGAIRMTNAVLPFMRRQRAGRIINLGSVVGRLALPFESLYDASKFALEGYSEALRHELRPLGIHVSIVEPGFVATGLARKAQTGAHPIDDYAPWRERATNAVLDHEDRGTAPEAVAETILRILDSRSPRLRYKVGRDASRFLRLRRTLPYSLFEWGVRREFLPDEPRTERRGGSDSREPA